MKKSLMAFLALALIVTSAAPASVEAQTSVFANLVAQLEAQITELKLKIQALTTAQQEATTAATNAVTTISLIRSMQVGTSGEDVRILQALLAADATIYPEALITGFYGPLTAKAVRAFQKKHGIDQLGIVGPMTLARLNQELRLQADFAIDRDNDDEDDDNDRDEKKKDKDDNRKITICHVPSGNLQAAHTITVSKKALVAHILHGDKLGSCNGTVPPAPTSTDTTAPTLSAITAVNISANTAVIRWQTNEAATSRVWFGTALPITVGLPTASVSKGDLETNHELSLTGLSVNTTYYYLVESSDASGNKSVSGTFSFVTTAAPDTTKPSITSVSASAVTHNAATINWQTNEPATTVGWYSTTLPVVVDASSTLHHSNTTLASSHSANLTGLSANTTYYFIVESTDSAGNKATLGTYAVTTAAAPDTTAPVISGLTVTALASTSATVTWTTDEPATTVVWYSTSSPVNVGASSTPSVVVAGTGTTHAALLTGLSASTTYNFVAQSSDTSGNSVQATQASFVTLGL